MANSALAIQVANIFKEAWATRAGRKVPEPSDLKLGNDAVQFDAATILYADLTGSTKLVDAESWTFAAEIYKAYLHCAATIVRAEGGAIVSYDGDRIMGVFIGETQATPAAKAGLKINYAVEEIINPALATQYPKKPFIVSQVVGIDTSPIRAARTGVRGDNDLVWVGRAANYAAKLTDLKLAERTWVTKATYDRLAADAKLGGPNRQPMWKRYNWTQMNNQPIYGSTWRWSV
ncbi:MAG: adenylate/guanylate cyclase domain-containing protein [Pseudomonadota bacterium]